MRHLDGCQRASRFMWWEEMRTRDSSFQQFCSCVTSVASAAARGGGGTPFQCLRLYHDNRKLQADTDAEYFFIRQFCQTNATVKKYAAVEAVVSTPWVWRLLNRATGFEEGNFIIVNERRQRVILPHLRANYFNSVRLPEGFPDATSFGHGALHRLVREAGGRDVLLQKLKEGLRRLVSEADKGNESLSLFPALSRDERALVCRMFYDWFDSHGRGDSVKQLEHSVSEGVLRAAPPEFLAALRMQETGETKVSAALNARIAVEVMVQLRSSLIALGREDGNFLTQSEFMRILKERTPMTKLESETGVLFVEDGEISWTLFGYHFAGSHAERNSGAGAQPPTGFRFFDPLKPEGLEHLGLASRSRKGVLRITKRARRMVRWARKVLGFDGEHLQENYEPLRESEVFPLLRLTRHHDRQRAKSAICGIEDASGKNLPEEDVVRLFLELFEACCQAVKDAHHYEKFFRFNLKLNDYLRKHEETSRAVVCFETAPLPIGEEQDENVTVFIGTVDLGEGVTGSTPLEMQKTCTRIRQKLDKLRIAMTILSAPATKAVDSRSILEEVVKRDQAKREVNSLGRFTEALQHTLGTPLDGLEMAIGPMIEASSQRPDAKLSEFADRLKPAYRAVQSARVILSDLERMAKDQAATVRLSLDEVFENAVSNFRFTAWRRLNIVRALARTLIPIRRSSLPKGYAPFGYYTLLQCCITELLSNASHANLESDDGVDGAGNKVYGTLSSWAPFWLIDGKKPESFLASLRAHPRDIIVEGTLPMDELQRSLIVAGLRSLSGDGEAPKSNADSPVLFTANQLEGGLVSYRCECEGETVESGPIPFALEVIVRETVCASTRKKVRSRGWNIATENYYELEVAAPRPKNSRFVLPPVLERRETIVGLQGILDYYCTDLRPPGLGMFSVQYWLRRYCNEDFGKGSLFLCEEKGQYYAEGLRDDYQRVSVHCLFPKATKEWGPRH